jgi:STE24 endopeptidase
MAAMRLSTYRKLKPGPLEEFVFYDHPSGYDRVRRSMIWLKENQNATPPQQRR